MSCTRVLQRAHCRLDSTTHNAPRAHASHLPARETHYATRTASLPTVYPKPRKLQRVTRLVTTSAFNFNLPFNLSTFLKPPELKEPVALSEGYEVEGSWVLKPEGRRVGVVHLLGGAFVGASPQVSYSLLMEELANMGFIVIATPYDLTFDHCKCAEKVANMLDRALAQMCIHAECDEKAPEGFQTLPLFSVGHSNGSLLSLLAGSLPSCSSTAYGKVQRAVLMSFNNKPASDAVPGGVPDVARTFAGQFQEISLSLRPQSDALRSALPKEARDFANRVLPFIDQLDPTFDELANGAQEFSPTPSESRRIIADGYRIPSTLLIRFKNDGIDESPEMLELLLKNFKGTKQVELEEMSGLGHITPVGGYVDWTVGEAFTPLDALGQAVKGEAVQRIRKVATRVNKWLTA
eukprot:CAMPEP_0198229510 /NCGR_PEP_ID=MMETSP1445-20131203/114162_1 /TAXON_ID=36898 /ORGANISM="Pyramimonas sp., Strain CCMP2087" /LENGTH=406 /DNA_ID=CAMNT_0043909973 /DNA_START=143 /DNA_END=1363 /DNA_ORIENTATION=+